VRAHDERDGDGAREDSDRDHVDGPDGQRQRGERVPDGLRRGVPDEDRRVLDDDGQRHHGEHGDLDGLIAQASQDQPLHDRTDERDARHRQEARDEEIDAPQREERVEEEGAQHEELAVGEVDHAHDAEDEGEADPHQGIAAPQDEAVDDVLDELGEHGRKDGGRPFRRPPHVVPATRVS